MSLRSDWLAEIRKRFSGRELLSFDVLYRRFWIDSDLSPESVREALTPFQEEFGLPVGLVRPDDELETFFEPVATRRPWRWGVYQVMAGDKENWLDSLIASRLMRAGLKDEWGGKIFTIDDYVRAWCGKPPAN